MRGHALVTGATGFIGRALVRRLKEEGVEVSATSLRGGRVEGIEVAAIDLTRPDGGHALCAGKEIGVFFHLAAEIPNFFMGPVAERSFWANIAMTLKVLKIASRRRCQFVYASSTSVYGPRPPTPCTEASPTYCDNFYSAGKYTGEILCNQFSMNSGNPLAILRISAPYGPGNSRATVINTFISRALRSEDLILYGTGMRQQDFTYIDDIVNALWLVYQRSAVGVFNIASGRSVTMRQLAEHVLEALPGVRGRIVSAGVPDPQEDYRPSFSIQKARGTFGYEPKTSLTDGLKRCAEAFEGRAA